MAERPATIETLWEAHNALTIARAFLPTKVEIGRPDYLTAIDDTLGTILLHIEVLEAEKTT